MNVFGLSLGFRSFYLIVAQLFFLFLICTPQRCDLGTKQGKESLIYRGIINTHEVLQGTFTYTNLTWFWPPPSEVFRYYRYFYQQKIRNKFLKTDLPTFPFRDRAEPRSQIFWKQTPRAFHCGTALKNPSHLQWTLLFKKVLREYEAGACFIDEETEDQDHRPSKWQNACRVQVSHTNPRLLPPQNNHLELARRVSWPSPRPKLKLCTSLLSPGFSGPGDWPQIIPCSFPKETNPPTCLALSTLLNKLTDSEGRC